MSDLVRRYNELVEQARGLGLDAHRPRERFATDELALRAVVRVQSSIRAAMDARRAEMGRGVITGEGTGVPVPTSEEAAMAERKRDRKRREARVAKTNGARQRAAGEMTLRQITEEYNKLVPRAAKKGLKVKVHTSTFGTREHGVRMLEELRAQLG